MAAVELPGEDFATVDTNVRIPAAQAVMNMMMGPAFVMNPGNHAATFGTNPELVGTYMPGQNYPYTPGYGPQNFGGAQGYGGGGYGAPPPTWMGGGGGYGAPQGYGGGGYGSPQGYGGGGYGAPQGYGGYGTAQANVSPQSGGKSPIEGGSQGNLGNNDFTHPGPSEWGAQQGMFASVAPTWNRGLQGGWQATGPQYGGNFGMMAQYQPDYLNSQSAGSLAAYYGGQMPGGQGQGSFDRFNDAEGSYMRRYATGVTDPNTGQQITPSWEQLTGERGQTTLGGYDYSGNPNGPGVAKAGANTDIYKAFQQYMQGNAVPGQDPFQQYMRQQGINQEGPDVRGIVSRAQGGMEGLNRGAIDATGRVVQGGVGDTAGAVNRGISGVAGLRGQYDYAGVGDLGIDRTRTLGTTLEDQLSSDMDTRAQRLVANKLQQTQATMEAMGMGASGAGQRQVKMNTKDILDEATRNKNQMLAQFQEANAQRNAAAIGRATDLTGAGMRDMMGYQANIMGQGMGLNANAIGQGMGYNANILGQGLGYGANLYGQGMGLEAGAAEAGRQRLSSALQGGMDRASNVALDQQQRVLAALQAGDQSAYQRQMGQAQIQGQGLQEYMGLQNTKDQMRGQRLQEMMTLEDYMRAQKQRQYDEMVQYGMLPFNTMTGMAGMGGGFQGPISKGPSGVSAGLGYASSALNFGSSLMNIGAQAQR